MEEIKEGRLKGLRVGDKCYCLINGDGIVSKILGNTYCIVVSFSNTENHRTYTMDGRLSLGYAEPMLYFSKPEIIELPRPKRKVTKTVERWVNVYTADENVHLTKELADNVWCADQRIACVHITGTYEIEE